MKHVHFLEPITSVTDGAGLFAKLARPDWAHYEAEKYVSGPIV